MENFRRNWDRIFSPLVYLDELHRTKEVRTAIWSSPPAGGMRALIAEFLLTAGVPVLGMQHGGGYIVQDCGKVHFDSDFSRCTHFLTYGFTGADAAAAYPDGEFCCQFIPVGSPKEDKRRGKKTRRGKIKLLYLMANSLSCFADAYRANAYYLYECQKEIIGYIDALTEVSACIKPIPNYNQENCATGELFNSLENARLIEDLTFVDCLDFYDIESVIMDYPSTPLFEAVGRDVDIFLMKDPVLPFTGEAMTLLAKRVHCFDDVRSLTGAISEYLQGRLPRLRDRSFYERFVHRSGVEARISQIIDELMEKGSRQTSAGLCS